MRYKLIILNNKFTHHQKIQSMKSFVKCIIALLFLQIQIASSSEIVRVTVYYANNEWLGPKSMAIGRSVKEKLQFICYNHSCRMVINNDLHDNSALFTAIDNSIRSLDTSDIYDIPTFANRASRLICLIERKDKTIDTIAMGYDGGVQINDKMTSINIANALLLQEIVSYLPSYGNPIRKSVKLLIQDIIKSEDIRLDE